MWIGGAASGGAGSLALAGSESEYCTVSFHNFKSQNFKLCVSNPKSKYVAYLSVLPQISNCQGLGRKNKHEILKTDRSRERVGTLYELGFLANLVG